MTRIQTLIVQSADLDTIFDPSGETRPSRLSRCGRSSSRSAAPVCLPDKPTGVRFGKRGAILRARGAPVESQTLIVPSLDPDTILVPSGENATDKIHWLWAFVFSLSSSSLSARQANTAPVSAKERRFEGAAHPNPRL